MKAVFWLGIMFLMQISCLRFKQSRISLLISHIYVLGCFVNFVVIFRYIWREIVFFGKKFVFSKKNPSVTLSQSCLFNFLFIFIR